MPLETGTYISDLVSTNPAHTDGLDQADAHLRLIKAALKATFPNINAAVNLSDEQLNALPPLAVTRGVDGSGGAPAYSFASETTLGFYRLSAGIVGLSGLLRGNGMVPAGALMDFAMASAPTGWLTCDGQAVSRATYADLFAAIGTTWGAGDGSTTFNVPPAGWRYRRHRDAGGTQTGGVGTLQGPLNLSHNHTFSGSTGGRSADHTHTWGSSGSGTTTGMNRNNPHSHALSAAFTNSSTGGGSFSCGGAVSGGNTNATDINHEHGFSYSLSGTTSGESVDHTHGYSGTTSGGSADGNEARPYSMTVLTCIKA